MAAQNISGVRSRRRRSLPPVALTLPAAVLLFLVLFLPILTGVGASLFHVELIAPANGRFIGLANYLRVFRSADFWYALEVTALYSLGCVGGAWCIGLATALLLHRKFRGRGLARTLIIMPWAVPQVVAAMVWGWMFDANYGVLNDLLERLHLIQGNLRWPETPSLALLGTVMVTVWCIFPVATVMLLAGLTSIPDELYEAASVDGAGAGMQFRAITWPSLKPVNVFLVLMLFLIAFTRAITIIYVLTGGGPSSATETLPLQTYLQAFKFSQLGYGSTTGTIVMALALLASVLWLRALSRGREALA